MTEPVCDSILAEKSDDDNNDDEFLFDPNAEEEEVSDQHAESDDISESEMSPESETNTTSDLILQDTTYTNYCEFAKEYLINLLKDRGLKKKKNLTNYHFIQ